MNMYYDGTKLLSLKDADGHTPELFIASSNRSAGKTTYFSKMLFKRFLKSGAPFACIYRYNNELDSAAEQFFSPISSFWPEFTVTTRSSKMGFSTLYANDKKFGYAVSLNAVDKIKKYSNLLSDTSSFFFDEFQPESGKYLKDECSKLFAIHTSIARGGGAQHKYLPVYMCCNPVTLVNPYYIRLGIASRINLKQEFYRGKGFVLQHTFNQSAAHAICHSGFASALASNKDIQYAAMGVYLYDNACFIDNKPQNAKYLYSIIWNGHWFSVWSDDSFFILTDSVDHTFPIKYSLKADDHSDSDKQVSLYSPLLAITAQAFRDGRLRFKNQLCKKAGFEMLMLC